MAKSAVRGQRGVLDTSMLVRYSPFGEWVNIYYDPNKITEDQILTQIRKNGCAGSQLIRNAPKNTTMNPYLAAGDTLQLRLHLENEAKVEISNMPAGWVIDSDENHRYQPGINYINIRTPRKTRSGGYSIHLKPDDQDVIKYSATVVKLVS